MLDIAISQEELKKNEQEAVKNQIKFEEKQAKIKADLIKNAVQGNAFGPVAVGGDMLEGFAPASEPDADGLPLIDINSKLV